MHGFTIILNGLLANKGQLDGLPYTIKIHKGNSRNWTQDCWEMP